jgi:hypothetical protein
MRARVSRRLATPVVLAALALGAAGTSGAAVPAAPSTTLTSTPQGNVTGGMQLADPGTLGTFRGTTESDLKDVIKIRVFVTNPLGDIREYESTNARSGWRFSNALPSKSTTWSWVSPPNNHVINTLWYDNIPTVPDLFYSYPGEYTVSFRGVDEVGNAELGSAGNTTVVQVL